METKAFMKEGIDHGDTYFFDSAKLEELNRLEQQSSGINAVMLNKPIQAPLDQPMRILEIGCGTGLMTCLLGCQYPSAQVIGVDPSPVPTHMHDRPENVEYIQAKFEDLLEQGDERLKPGSFDYVFSRMLTLVISDWPLYVSRVASLLKPGGRMELHEIDAYTHFSPSSTSPDGSVGKDWEWARVIKEESLARGVHCSLGSQLGSIMESAGLTEVESFPFIWPLCEWPERPETQLLFEYNDRFVPPVTLQILERFAPPKYNNDEIEGLKKEALETGLSGKIDRLHWKIYSCVGRVP